MKYSVFRSSGRKGRGTPKQKEALCLESQCKGTEHSVGLSPSRSAANFTPADEPHYSPPLAVSAIRTGQSFGTDGSNAVHRQTVVRARPGSLRGNHRLSSTFTHGMPFIHDGAFGQRCDVRPRDIRESPLPCHPQVQTPLKHPNLLLQQSRVKRISNCYMRWSLALVVQSAPLHVTRTHKHAGSCVLVHDCASMRHHLFRYRKLGVGCLTTQLASPGLG